MIGYRKARAEDAERIGVVDRDAFVDSPYGEKTGLAEDPEKQRSRQENAQDFCKRRPDWVFVAEEHDTVVGFATLEYWPEKRAGRIENNAVLPEYRGHGISTELVGRALDELRLLGARSAAVHTSHVPAACRAYEKAGFRIEKREGEHSYYRIEL